MTPLLPILATIPRPVLALLLMVAYGAAVRWRLAPWMVVDWALLALLVWQPSLGLAAWVGALLIVRHVPTLAEDIASGLKLHDYTGLTAACLRLLLPGARSLMVSGGDGEEETRGAQVVVEPMPGIAGSSAVAPPDRDITKDDWIVAMAEATDSKGAYVFSANQIDKAIGAHRATTLARVREVRSGVPVAQFRQDDGDTAPATYPVTKER